MSEMLAGIDWTLDGEYVAVVIGESNALHTNAQLLQTFRHMSLLRQDEKMPLLRKLRLNGNVLVYCIEFGLPKLRKDAAMRLKGYNIKKGERIALSIGYEMRQSIEALYGDFLTRNGLKLTDLQFEADDPPIIEYLRRAGLSTGHVQLTHKIADCIVHANGKRLHYNDNVKHSHKDFKVEFHKRVLNRIIR